MPLQIKEFRLGQMQNNTLVVFDPESKKGIIVDPTFQNQPVLDFIRDQSLLIESILCTHAHFDHFAGVPLLAESLSPHPTVMLNKKDLALWQDGGGSKQFNFLIKLLPRPDAFISHAQIIHLGDSQIEIREVPGHSPGSVILYIPSLNTAICGDAIFYESIGRTDLKDGDHETLLTSIRSQIFTLPEDTILIPGHGEHTTVAHEKQYNPFLQD